MNSESRFVSFILVAVFAYVAVEYAIERRRSFAAWRADFLAPFVKNPGRREFLRDALMTEEMTIRNAKDSTDARS